MMRRTPLKRGKPLRRTGWLRARSKTNSYRKRERNFKRMGKVSRLPCVVLKWRDICARLKIGAELPDDVMDLIELLMVRHNVYILPVTTCSGRVQVDHVGERPYGHRSSDDETVGACRKHHGERTGEPQWSGTVTTFSGFNAEEMRAWCEWALRVTNRELEEMDCHTAALDSSSL